MTSCTLVSVPGAALRLEEEGTGIPIVLLHGWALDRRMWGPVAAELKSDFRVIRYDRRGFGQSTGLPSVVDDVADLGIVLDTLRASPAILVGMSQATRIAVDAAARAYPQRVSALVLDGAPPDLADATAVSDIDLGHFRDLIARRGVAAFRLEWARHPCMRLYRAAAAHRALLRQITSEVAALDLLDADPSAARLSHPAAAFATLATPVLLLNGAHDSAARLRSSSLVAALLRSPHRQCVFEKSGHLGALDCPQEYADSIRRWVDSLAEYNAWRASS